MTVLQLLRAALSLAVLVGPARCRLRSIRAPARFAAIWAVCRVTTVAKSHETSKRQHQDHPDPEPALPSRLGPFVLTSLCSRPEPDLLFILYLSREKWKGVSANFFANFAAIFFTRRDPPRPVFYPLYAPSVPGGMRRSPQRPAAAPSTSGSAAALEAREPATAPCRPTHAPSEDVTGVHCPAAFIESRTRNSGREHQQRRTSASHSAVSPALPGQTHAQRAARNTS